MRNFKRFLEVVMGVLEFMWYSRKELFYGLRFVIGFFWGAFVLFLVASLFTYGTSRGEIVEMGLFALRNYPVASVVSILLWIVPTIYLSVRGKLSQHNAVKI